MLLLDLFDFFFLLLQLFVELLFDLVLRLLEDGKLSKLFLLLLDGDLGPLVQHLHVLDCDKLDLNLILYFRVLGGELVVFALDLGCLLSRFSQQLVELLLSLVDLLLILLLSHGHLSFVLIDLLHHLVLEGLDLVQPVSLDGLFIVKVGLQLPLKQFLLHRQLFQIRLEAVELSGELALKLGLFSRKLLLHLQIHGTGLVSLLQELLLLLLEGLLILGGFSLQLLELLLQRLKLLSIVFLDLLLMQLSLLKLGVEVFSDLSHLLLEARHVRSTLFNLFLQLKTLLLEFLFERLLPQLLLLQLLGVPLLKHLFLLGNLSLRLGQLLLERLQLLFDLDLGLGQLLATCELLVEFLMLLIQLLRFRGQHLVLRSDLLVQARDLGLE